MQQQMPVIGLVQQVDGSTIKLKDPMTGTEHSLQVSSETRIHTQGQVDVSGVAAGDTLSAVGAQTGDTFQAEFVQVGKAGALSGGPVSIGGPHEENPQGNEVLGGSPAAAPSNQQGLSGTVQSVDGEQIVVKSDAGATVTLKLASGAQIQKDLTIQASQVEAGKLIIANGTQNGADFKATDIEVLPAPPTP